MASWRTTVRLGGRVERDGHATLADALDAMERRLDELAGQTDRRGERVLGREFPAAAVVAARGEVAGPGRRRGGVDLHADRSATPWTGRFQRRAVEPRPGETAYEALARVLGG